MESFEPQATMCRIREAESTANSKREDNMSDKLPAGTFKLSDISNAALLLGLLADVRDRKVEVLATENDDEFTVTASKRSKRAEAREARDSRTASIKVLALEALEVARPMKIGPLVDSVAVALGVEGKEAVHDLRAEVLNALRELRTAGTLISQNSSESNFHMRWTLAAKPDAFPVPEAKPLKEPKAKKEPKVEKLAKDRKSKTPEQAVETIEVKAEDRITEKLFTEASDLNKAAA